MRFVEGRAAPRSALVETDSSMVYQTAFIKRLKAECDNVERPFRTLRSTSACWRALKPSRQNCVSCSEPIQVRMWALKPCSQVKRRPPTAPHLYFTELAASLAYILITSNIC